MQTEQTKYIRQITDFKPEIAIILGSGLGELAEKVKNKISISYKNIPNMPISTAPSHKGELILGELAGKKVAVMQGRVHLYEGYTPQEILIPIRMLKDLGAEKIILTNAVGAINKNFNVGELMMITDHISCFIDSCLIGKNDDNYGVRFPDMSNVYDADLQNIIEKTAKDNNIKLNKGVFVQLKGPQFETPAEIRMLEKLGADSVGMSTVIDAIAANHCKMKVCAVSLISNMACGISERPLSSEEVCEAAEKAAPIFEKLITEITRNM